MLLFIAFLDWDDVEKKFFFYGKFVCIYTMEDLNYELEGDEGWEKSIGSVNAELGDNPGKGIEPPL